MEKAPAPPGGRVMQELSQTLLRFTAWLFTALTVRKRNESRYPAHREAIFMAGCVTV